MSTFNDQLGIITFKDLKVIQKRANLVIVEHNAVKYGISMTRLNKSSKDDDQELVISEDGKWLIPTDTFKSALADW